MHRAQPKGRKHRTRLVVGGNRINYPGEVGKPTTKMLLTNIMLNSIISSPGAKFMTINIANFYFATPMERYEYIKPKLSALPAKIIKEYKLLSIATPNGSVYVEVRKRHIWITAGRKTH